MQWWVIPEGLAGQVVNAFSFQGPALHVYTAVQSAARPPGAVSGPFPDQQTAQADADKRNAQSTGTAPHVAQAAASDISQSTLGPLFQANLWLRVAEVVAGLILLAIGVNAMFKGAPLKVVTNTAGAAAKAVPLAAV